MNEGTSGERILNTSTQDHTGVCQSFKMAQLRTALETASEAEAEATEEPDREAEPLIDAEAKEAEEPERAKEVSI